MIIFGEQNNVDDRKKAALQRIRGINEVREHAFFIGEAAADLAAMYKGRSGAVQTAADLEEGRKLLTGAFPAQVSMPKVLLVVAIDSVIDRSPDRLRRLVEPLDQLLGADPRMVLIGDVSFNDFSSVRSLLWSHVVDWFSVDLERETALRRLDRAWRRNSFRRRLLGLGLVSGAPVHVVTHHKTRLQMAKDLRLDHLTKEPLFRSIIKGTSSEASWDSFAEDLYWDLWASIQDSPEEWAGSFDLGQPRLEALKSSGLGSQENRQLLLRFWCALLANRMEGVIDMTRKDLRELEEYIEGVDRDFLKEGEDNE